MKKNRKILATLLVSTQLLGFVAPLHVQAENEFDGQTTTEYRIPGSFKGTQITQEVIDKVNEYILNDTYSEALENKLDELIERAEEMETNKELDEIIKEYTSIYEYFEEDDISHYLADSQLIGTKKGFRVHEHIRNAIYDMGESGSARLINYANQLVMAMTNDASGFENQVNDLFSTHRIVSADLEMYRIHNTMQVYIGAVENGDDMELKIVAGRLTSPLHEELGIDLGRPPEIIEEPDTGIDNSPRPDTGIRTDDESYPTSDRDNHSSDLGSRSGHYYEFDAENGRRIRVDYTIEYVNGKEQRNETRTVEATGLTSMWSDTYSGFFNAKGGGVIDHHEVDDGEDERSRLTLQYTLNKSDEFPTYVDTGLFADANGNTTYESLYEVLYQIAVNADDGYLVEDSDKLLIVVEGRPVYILEEKNQYTQSEIEDIFDDFEDVGLIVSETRIGTTNSLEWQLKTGQEQRIVIDGEEVEIKTTPAIREDRVVLPIVEMMEAVGAEVSTDDTVITVNYSDHVITFESGVSEARVDGQLVDLTAPVEVDERGTMTANLTPIFEQLNIEAVWDEQDSTLFLDNTLRPVQDDNGEEETENEESENEDTEIEETENEE